MPAEIEALEECLILCPWNEVHDSSRLHEKGWERKCANPQTQVECGLLGDVRNGDQPWSPASGREVTSEAMYLTCTYKGGSPPAAEEAQSQVRLWIMEAGETKTGKGGLGRMTRMPPIPG